MDKLKNRTLKQKMLIVVIAIVLLFNFIIPNYSNAADDGDNILFSPVRFFITAIADSVMSLIHWCFTGEWKDVTDKIATSDDEEKWHKADKIAWPDLQVTPEEIFHGKVLALNVNFIKGYDDVDTNGIIQADSTKNNLNSLRNTISKWYMALRNVSIVGLLCILVYIGIRMIISSTAAEKAKYKQMIMDWIVALCLIFFLHYIMALTMEIVESINDMFASASVEGIQINDKFTVDGKEVKRVRNLMEYARLYANLAKVSNAFSFLIVYVWLVVYTVRFILVYMKRFIHMAFLTLIAPLVALTYPLDKISDGKAQAFNMWLKDYIFNALIQPFHLLVYTIFVSLAIDFATENLIYACVAIGFIAHAEKFMKKLFGFDKAPSSASALGSFTGGALASQAISKLRSGVSSKSGGGNGGKGGSSGGSKPPRTNPGYEGYIGEKGENKNKDNSNGNMNGNMGENSQGELQAGNSNVSTNTGQTQYNSMQTRNNNPPEGLISGNDTNTNNTMSQGNTNKQIDKEDDNRGITQWAKDGFHSHIGAPVGAKAKQLVNRAKTSAPGQKLKGAKDTINRGIKHIPKPIRNSIKGVSRATGKRLKAVGKSAIRTLPKAALGIGGAAIGGAAMGLYALATDKEPNDILKSAVMGAAGGAVFANKAGSSIAGTGKNFAYDVRAGYDKAGADAKMDKKAFMANEANKEFVKRNFSSKDGTELRGKELKAKMEQSYAMYQAGIVDETERKKVMDFEDKKYAQMEEAAAQKGKTFDEQEQKEKRQQARQRALYTNKAAKDIKTMELLEKSETIRENLAGNVMEKYNDIDKNEANYIANTVVDDIAEYKGVSKETIRAKEVERFYGKQKNANKSTGNERSHSGSNV